MPTPVSQLIIEAREYSPRNKARTATDAVLTREVNRVHRELIVRQPDRYTKKSTISAPGAGLPWVLQGASRILFIEKDDGTLVEFGELKDRDQLGPVSVYAAGRALYAGRPPTGETDPDPDPASDDLIVIHGKVPDALTSLTDELDEEFPVEFERLIVIHLTRFMARKEQRNEEFLQLDDEWVDLLKLYDVISASWGVKGFMADGSNPSYPQSAVYRR